MGVIIQLRRGTSAEWTAADPVLLAGEVGVETDTHRIKIGNGSDKWSELPYIEAVVETGIGDGDIVGVDDESVASGQFPRWTNSGLEGLTLAEMLTSLFGSALPENVGLILDASLSADGKYSPVASESGTLGDTVAFGEVCYFKAADSKWYLAKGDAAATATGKLGICLVGGNADDATAIMLIGKVRADAKFPFLTVGAAMYLSTATGGAVTTTLPSKSTGHIVRVLGQANTADEIWFNPSPDWGEYA